MEVERRGGGERKAEREEKGNGERGFFPSYFADTLAQRPAAVLHLIDSPGTMNVVYLSCVQFNKRLLAH